MQTKFKIIEFALMESSIVSVTTDLEVRHVPFEFDFATGVHLSHIPSEVVTKIEPADRCSQQLLAYSDPSVDLEVVQSISRKKQCCSLCYRDAYCLCEDCAAGRSNFYQMRMKQARLEADKHQLEIEIETRLNESTILFECLHTTSTSVAHLRALIISKKERKYLLKHRLQRNHEIRANSFETSRTLTMTISIITDKILCKNMLIHSLDKRIDDDRMALESLRQQLALRLFDFFPVHEMGKSVRKTKTGVVADALAEARGISFVDGHWIGKIESNSSDFRILALANCPISDGDNCAMFKSVIVSCPASTSSKQWTRACSSCFAALCYAAQLVHKLCLVNDLYLPFELSSRELALTDRWTDTLFDTDMFKLNCSVLLLCLSYDIPSDQLVLSHPIGNLLFLSHHLIVRKWSKQNRHLASDLFAKLRLVEEQLDWRDHEREGPWQVTTFTDDWEQIGRDVW